MDNLRLHTHVRREGPLPVLAVAGEIDVFTAPLFKQAVVNLVSEGHRHLFLDMREVTFMDSSGFGALLGAPTRYIVTNEAPAGSRATALGLLSQFLIVGQILGGSIAGGIMTGAISDDSSYRWTYLTFAALALLALVLSLFLAPRRAELRT